MKPSDENNSTQTPAQLLLEQMINQYPVVDDEESKRQTSEQKALDSTQRLRILGIIRHWMDHHFYVRIILFLMIFLNIMQILCRISKTI
jgi:hypothetical protein